MSDNGRLPDDLCNRRENKPDQRFREISAAGEREGRPEAPFLEDFVFVHRRDPRSMDQIIDMHHTTHKKMERTMNMHRWKESAAV